MIYAFCGPPSSHTAFVSRLGTDILRETVGDFHFVAANSTEEMREGISQRQGRPCVLFFDVPDEKISQSVVMTGIPTVLVYEPFSDVVIYNMVSRGMTLVQATRFATQSAAALFPFAASDTIKAISLGGHKNELETLMSRIALSLDLKLSTENRKNILSLYGRDGQKDTILSEIIAESVDHVAGSVTLRSSMSPDDLAMILSLSAEYEPAMLGKPIVSITWPPWICLSGEKPHDRLRGSLDMTGAARAMSFGPYLHLPPGSWAAEVTFSIVGNYSGNQLMIDVMADGGVVCAGRAILPEIGTFTVSLNFDVTKPKMAVEVRTFILVGAIEGQFELIDIVMRPVITEVI